MDSENADDKSGIVIGPGLRQNLNSVIATKPGVLRFREPAVYWIDCHQKRVCSSSKTLSLGASVELLFTNEMNNKDICQVCLRISDLTVTVS